MDTVNTADSVKTPSLKKPTPAIPGKSLNNEDGPLYLFFIEALKDIYWAEQALVDGIPDLIDAATTDELADSLDEHLGETAIHVQRLEEVFQILGQPAAAKKCFAMEGIIKEAQSIVEETAEGSVTRDAALIMAAQKAEHYEIATYGALVEYAKTLGFNDVRGILQLTLDEERMADQGLTIIAQNKINWESELEDADDVAEIEGATALHDQEVAEEVREWNAGEEDDEEDNAVRKV